MRRWRPLVAKAAAWPDEDDDQGADSIAALSTRDLSREDYELIIVGSGNGACAFLTKYLDCTQGEQRRVLVIEEGSDFLATSAITHQANWTRSYGEASVFKLHDATTGPEAGNRPIITGRACTQGGGGSINYSMMHESSGWLAANLGAAGQESGTAGYWDALKADLGQRFDRLPPAANRTPVAEAVHQALTGSSSSSSSKQEVFEDVPDDASTGFIPSLIDDPAGQLHARVYTFNTQFNDFGQRSHSGVSLVARGAKWTRNKRIHLLTDSRVERLRFGRSLAGASSNATRALPCKCLRVRSLQGPDAGKAQWMKFDPSRTTVVLAAGSSTPRLLLPHRQALGNEAIGRHVNDHILLPAGFDLLKQEDGSPAVSPRDQYLPLFAVRDGGGDADGSGGAPVVVCFDFFAGPVADLSYFLSHLFVSLWLPNCAKTLALECPSFFRLVKQLTAWIIQGVQIGADIFYGALSLGKSFPTINVVTGIMKYNITYDGYYERQHLRGLFSAAGTAMVLKCFASTPGGERGADAVDSPDGRIAKAALPTLMRALDAVGNRPPRVVQWLLRKLSKMPFDPESEEQVDAYIRAYADSHLLTEQHLSGGCVLGEAAEDGSGDARQTGRVKGTANVVVADLSACPLPRISPQMTAYLLGSHVAAQRFAGRGT